MLYEVITPNRQPLRNHAKEERTALKNDLENRITSYNVCYTKLLRALAEQLDFQGCYYNFMRPHLALKFGNQIWTPAMMAGIMKRKLSWRDVLNHSFLAIMLVLLADRDVQENRVQAAA